MGKYRKVHIPGSWVPEGGRWLYEKEYFTPGNMGYPVYELEKVKVGVQICYDRMFPEGYRILALKGAQLIFQPTSLSLAYAGKDIHLLSWESLLRIRAVENNMFVVGVNRAGMENNVKFAGDSLIISPIAGDILAKAETDGDELVIAEINLDDILEAKKTGPYFRDRRPGQYEILVQREY